MKKIFIIFCILLSVFSVKAQIKWKNVDSLFQPLPKSVHVYFTNDSMLDGKPNIAYYVEVDLKDKKLNFETDTTWERRLTPNQFFERNHQPLLIVNCSFFEYAHNHNLNLVMNDGKILANNHHTIPLKGKDTLLYAHPFVSALGIDKKRNADVAWTYADSSMKRVYSSEEVIQAIKDSIKNHSYEEINLMTSIVNGHKGDLISSLQKWKMQTAVGGGPVLLQNGEIKITNNEELKFNGKTGLTDKHPRTCIGYTKDGKLIIMVIEGRHPNKAEGATLTQEAKLLKDIGCIEALNLDGGGSSCLLINGKETITPSEKGVQRPVPAVFMIKSK